MLVCKRVCSTCSRVAVFHYVVHPSNTRRPHCISLSLADRQTDRQTDTTTHTRRRWLHLGTRERERRQTDRQTDRSLSITIPGRNELSLYGLCLLRASRESPLINNTKWLWTSLTLTAPRGSMRIWTNDNKKGCWDYVSQLSLHVLWRWIKAGFKGLNTHCILGILILSFYFSRITVTR